MARVKENKNRDADGKLIKPPVKFITIKAKEAVETVTHSLKKGDVVERAELRLYRDLIDAGKVEIVKETAAKQTAKETR